MDYRLKLLILCVSWLVSPAPTAATVPSSFVNRSDEWLGSEEGRRMADNVLSWQSPLGGWPKNQDTASESFDGNRSQIKGTFDNGATTGELRFLTRSFNATKEPRYRLAIIKGLDHILEAQYPTGGWPQFYPPGRNYHRHITFNDNSMVRILEFLRDVGGAPDFAFLEMDQREAARAAFDRGIQCILEGQIVVDGRRTVWCAQHDEVHLRPRPGRSYELESLSGSESAGILQLLMSLENPGPEIQGAILAGVEWFESAKLTGLRIDRNPAGDRVVVEDANAPVIWARFYDLETNRPFFCGRDGVKKERLSQIEAERRNGYAWYGGWGRGVAEAYDEWGKRWLQTGE